MSSLAIIPSRSSSEALLERELTQAGLAIDAQHWLSASLTLALFASFTTASALLIATTPALALATSLLLFAALFFALKSLPKYLKSKRAQALEAELPFALRAIALTLDIGAPFERALKGIREGLIAKELIRVLEDSKVVGMPQALASMASRSASLHTKRACAALAFCYEQGGSTEALKQLASELTSIQRSKLREYAAKQGFVSLVFIAVACIVPTLFGAYSLIGSAVLDFNISIGEVWLAYLLAFPALDLLLILYLLEKSPHIWR